MKMWISLFAGVVYGRIIRVFFAPFSEGWLIMAGIGVLVYGLIVLAVELNKNKKEK